MNDKWLVIFSVIQLVIGIAAIIAFILLWIAGESMVKWIGALLLAIALVALGVIGIVRHK